MAHGQVDAEHLLLDDGRVGFLDFRGAVAAPTVDQRRLDQAQAFVTSIDLVGEERATALAIDALGMDRLTEVLPLVQPSAMTVNQQRRLRDTDVDLRRCPRQRRRAGRRRPRRRCSSCAGSASARRCGCCCRASPS